MGRDIGSREFPQLERTPTEPLKRDAEREPISRERQPHTGRGFVYSLSAAEIKTMTEIGRFRTIDERDLKEYRYRKSAEEMRDDLRSLQNQGLVRKHTVWTGNRGDHLTVFVLTKRGKAFLERDAQPDQKIFAGFVKPAEVHHDAAIYRMYQAEAAKIERFGGRVKRTVLDYELKQKVYKPLAKIRSKASPGSPEYSHSQAEIAAANQLKVIGGKILLPDLRIEFETATGEHSHVDLELATRHYRPSSLSAKAQAGFKTYASQTSGRTAPFDPEHISEIFSL